MYQVTDEEFKSFMEASMSSIPSGFSAKLENIVFIFEDCPSINDVERLNLKDVKSLLGLYSGVPYTHRNTWYGGTIPDRIILFKKNIEAIVNSETELKEKIKEVIIHEVAHYFGMDEQQIRNAGF
jgi:predicted Zn-dependent protease with MMP-like domain